MYLHDWRRGMRWCGFEVGSMRASSKAMRERMSWGRRHSMTFDWRGSEILRVAVISLLLEG